MTPDRIEKAPEGSFDPESNPSPAPVSDSTGKPPSIESTGSSIGPYKLLQKLGEGATGVVFMASQETPVKRRVAIKILEPGIDPAGVMARFEAERQALTMMDHPNIGRVLESGITKLGRPYFVMELISGVPITKLCDDQKLSIKDRLALFIPVCQAVQSAHQKGILHRNIKPSNVLGVLLEGKPFPKVVDFGMARAVGKSLADEPFFDAAGQPFGALPYLSPEQTVSGGLDLDTRGDIFSLGVLLYELLAGTTPVDPEKLRAVPFAEALRLLRENEPVKPSARLNELGPGLTELSTARKTRPSKLERLLRGELDTIVSKAIRTDRNERYDTAEALARDVQRHLAKKDVDACADSARYRLGKFASRHRFGLIAALAISTLLVVGTALGTWQAVRAARARDRNTAQLALEQANRSLEGTRRYAFVSSSALSFLEKRVLGAARPEAAEGGLGDRTTIRQAIDSAEPTVADIFKDHPASEALIRKAFGNTYRHLALPYQAVTQLERALQLEKGSFGPSSLETLVLQIDLARAYQAHARLDLAIPLFEQTLNALKALFPNDLPDILSTQNYLAAALQAKGMPEQSIALLQDTLDNLKAKLPPDHPEIFVSRSNLARAQQLNGRYKSAVTLLEENLDEMKKKQAIDNPSLIACQLDLAGAYRSDGQLDRAIPLLQETLEIQKTTLPARHISILASQNNLALAYRENGQLDQAIPLLESSLKGLKATLPNNAAFLLSSQAKLAETYKWTGRLDLAVPLYEETLKAMKANLPVDSHETLDIQNQLAEAIELQGNVTGAEALFRNTLEAQKKAGKPKSVLIADTLACLGINLLKQQRWAEAEKQLEESLPICKEKLPDQWPTFLITNALGGSLLGQKRHAEAEPLLVSGFDGLLAREQKIPAHSKFRFVEACERVVKLYEASGKPEKATEWRKKLEELRAKFPTVPSSGEVGASRP